MDLVAPIGRLVDPRIGRALGGGMKILTAVITGLIVNIGLGSAVATAQYYPRSEPPSYYSPDRSAWQAERIVRQAYLEILGREPDRSGLRQYTDAMVNRGWSEADVRRSLRESLEYRQGGGPVSDDRAAAMVRRAYRDILGREPDPVGMRDYTMRIVRDGWTERDVVQSLLNSREYRRRYY
jgi:hypothetical protein